MGEFNEQESGEIRKSITFSKRRAEIKDVIQELGIWNIDKTYLSKKYGVSRQTIYRDIDAIMLELGKVDVNRVGTAIRLSYDKAAKELIRIIHRGTNSEKVAASNALATINREVTSTLERYGHKVMTPEEHHHLVIGWDTEKKKKILAVGDIEEEDQDYGR